MTSTNLTMIRGDTVPINLTITNAQGAVDLTGCELWFSAKKSVADPDPPIIAKSSGVLGGIQVTDAAGGLATVTLDPADTSAFTADTQLLTYDVQLKDGAGNITTVASGYLTITADVTLATT